MTYENEWKGGFKMTDKLTLVNLRVAVGLNPVPVRFATLSDLVEVIESLGGETEWMLCPTHKSPWYEDEGLCQRAAAATAWHEDPDMYKDCVTPGRYVIFKLEEE